MGLQTFYPAVGHPVSWSWWLPLPPYHTAFDLPLPRLETLFTTLPLSSDPFVFSSFPFISFSSFPKDSPSQLTLGESSYIFPCPVLTLLLLIRTPSSSYINSIQSPASKMVQSAVLGFPRMGVLRDLKKATEACECLCPASSL